MAKPPPGVKVRGRRGREIAFGDNRSIFVMAGLDPSGFTRLWPAASCSLSAPNRGQRGDAVLVTQRQAPGLGPDMWRSSPLRTLFSALVRI
jgi:hypothetical protein